MTREQWARIKAVVATALECPPADRLAHLAAACGSDVSLRCDAESLLGAVEQAADLFEGPALRIAGVEPGADLFGAAAGLVGVPAVAAIDAEPLDSGDWTARYVLRRRIGMGGMGIVYEAEDRTRRHVVALKTLQRWHPADIYRLKREFRSLADIAHPNLVPLYELELDAERCFVTMALVDGVSFVEYVRAGPGPQSLAERARRCLAQLVAGVRELHRCGTRHGDVKPSNVLVTSAGRVSVLDFGLAASLTGGEDAERGLVGTPAYLSPEECRGDAATDASDWYAVGATLYHALAGVPPFDGPIGELLRRKVVTDPPAVHVVAPEVPEDLADICRGLLDRDPTTRWDGARVLRRLLIAPNAGDVVPPTPAFVGRGAAMAALGAAWLRVKDGAHAAVYLHGPSGIGKSALLRQFVAGVAREPGVVVLHSRCHEHESMPYKGLDGVVDGLSRHLRAVPREDAAALLGRDGPALARLFPVMQGLGAAVVGATDPLDADPIALRRQAFTALRDTLDRLARHGPLVVAIDDFHWADAESAMALAALFEPPSPPPALLLVSFRSEEIDVTPFLRTLVDRLDGDTSVAMALPPLADADVAQLVDRLLEGRPTGTAGNRQAIAGAAGGHPLLIEELARSLDDGPDIHGGVTLDEMLTRRLGRLSSEARAFLDTLAVCGRPIAAARVFEVAGLSGDDRPLVATLRAAHFLRGTQSPGRVELYHDRLRETLAAAVDAEVARAIHGRMAALLVAHGDDDPEALFEHYQAAGRHSEAAEQAAASAAKADGVLAFDRAAALYRRALVLAPDADGAAAWAARLAVALENGGRPVEAAEAYLEAARRTGASQVEWQRKAAELFLVGGDIDRGLRVSESVLAAAGVRLARSAGTALASLALRRLQLRWRGLDLHDASRVRPDPGDLLRIDACWSISVGLAMVDPLRAADFNARQLLWALDAGDRQRIARALALEAGFSSIVRVGAGWHGDVDLFQRAEALAAGTGPPYVSALAAAWAGIGAFLTGRWAEATRLCGRAERLFSNHCTGVTWELNLAHGFLLYSLLYRGELREAAGRLPSLLAAARERGNVYLELELSTRLSILWLAADEPDEAERCATASMAQWHQRGFQRPHYHHLLTSIQVRLYRGEGAEAWTLLHRHRAQLRQRLFRQVQHTRVEAANVRARCALARAAKDDDAVRMRAAAVREAQAIAQERMPWSNPFAALIRGAVAFQEGDLAGATECLTRAIDEFTAADMALYAMAARWRLAGVLGSGRGRSLSDDAGRWFAAQGVRDIVALTRVLAPGFPDQPQR